MKRDGYAQRQRLLFLLLVSLNFIQKSLTFVPIQQKKYRQQCTKKSNNYQPPPKTTRSYVLVPPQHATTTQHHTKGNTTNNTFSNKKRPYKKKVIKSKNQSPTKPSRSKSSSSSSSSSLSKSPENIFAEKFAEIQQKDSAGETLSQEYCDAILGLCVASNEWDNVLVVMEIMKRQGLTQERSTYQACFQACFDVGNGSAAMEILDAMEKALLEPDPQDILLVVCAMCRNDKTEPGFVKNAISILQSAASKAKSKDYVVPVDAYDFVLSRLAEEKKWQDSVRLLRYMEESTNQGSAYFCPEPQLSTYRLVIECCVAASKAEQAVQILLSMKTRGLTPTSYAVELVISALSRKLQWRRALEMLDLMDELNIPKTVVTYNTVISACARAREIGMAKSLLSKMRKQGIKPNVITYNSLISACANTARWRDALAILDQCYREPGVLPDIYTYTNAMRACAKGGKTSRALNLLQVVKDKKLPVDTYCYTAVIDACAKAKMWKKALELLDEMKQQNIEPSEVTYSVTISACGNGGQWEKALDLLDVMRQKEMKINAITYNNAIAALATASRRKVRYQNKHSNPKRRFDTKPQQSEEQFQVEDLWPKVKALLQQMKKDGIEPDGYSYSSAISCCGGEGKWEEALELIQIMKKGGPKTRPNKIAYTAAISACGRAGECQHAIDLFRTMKQEGLPADKVAYNAVFSALRVAGEADEAFELWGEICGKTTSGKPIVGGGGKRVAIATAKADASARPDIITVTECIAALSRSDPQKNMIRVDQVFAEAVARGIVLHGNSLDSHFDVDLSGMTFPVARAACRYIIRQALHLVKEGRDLTDVILITGVGVAHDNSTATTTTTTAITNDYSFDSEDDISLRDYVQKVLLSDFDPPIISYIPRLAQGTVQVDKDTLEDWVDAQ